jgi:hypothetical protein
MGFSFMQGIYTYIPETNHVPREHCVATIVVIIIIIILGFSVMQGIYTYIPETNHVPRENVLQLFWCYYSWCSYR